MLDSGGISACLKDVQLIALIIGISMDSTVEEALALAVRLSPFDRGALGWFMASPVALESPGSVLITTLLSESAPTSANAVGNP